MSDAGPSEHAAARGKINRLPASIRQQLNVRLRDGEMGPSVLPWLNALPETRALIQRDFGGAEVSPQNLSEWRAGGYAKWLKGQERVEQIARLSEMSLQLARASGGNLSEGAVAIAGGQILEVLENVADLPFGVEKGDPSPNLSGLVEALVALRTTELNTHKIAIERTKVAQKDELLAFERQKWQRQTIELFLKFYDAQKAKEIMESGKGKAVKMDELSLLMFGTNPLAH